MPKPALAAAIAAAIVAVSAAVLVPSDEGGAAAAAPPAADGTASASPAAVRSLEVRGRREAMQQGLRPAPGDRPAWAVRNARAARVALRYLGTPYVYGGGSPGGFDCSGLVSYAYAQVGVPMDHNTNAIWGAFPKVPRDRLQIGDMVFFSGLGHMGIYVGRGRYVHAPQSGEVVEVARLDERDDYLGAVRAG
ncbi:MAG TPA: C40 family peptidase [Miltoncostaeaceae bacterium]|nr:C40 family peptidase [Miltoncostaeaceae bacterium]